MPEFSLRSLVRDVAATSNSADPGALADEVFKKIPKSDVGGALKETLRTYVRLILATDRMPEPPQAMHETADASAAGSKPSTRSWKRDGVRKSWKSRLRDHIHVGPESTAWKFLGQCNYDELMFAADERRHAAERTLARSAFYEGLAKLLKDHAVTSVEELPEPVLAVHLGNEGGESE